MPALAGLSLQIQLPSATLQCEGCYACSPLKHLGWWRGCGSDLEEGKQLWVPLAGGLRSTRKMFMGGLWEGHGCASHTQGVGL